MAPVVVNKKVFSFLFCDSDELTRQNRANACLQKHGCIKKFLSRVFLVVMQFCRVDDLRRRKWSVSFRLFFEVTATCKVQEGQKPEVW